MESTAWRSFGYRILRGDGVEVSYVGYESAKKYLLFSRSSTSACDISQMFRARFYSRESCGGYHASLSRGSEMIGWPCRLLEFSSCPSNMLKGPRRNSDDLGSVTCLLHIIHSIIQYFVSCAVAEKIIEALLSPLPVAQTLDALP